MACEASNEDEKDDQKSDEIFEKCKNDDSPGPKQRVKSEELQQLHKGEKIGPGQDLVPDVEDF